MSEQEKRYVRSSLLKQCHNLMMELFYRHLVYTVPASEPMALKIHKMNTKAIQGELDRRLEEDIMALGSTMNHSNRAFVLQRS